jgi:hypothetical protein
VSSSNRGLPPINQPRATCSPSACSSRVHNRCASCRRRVKSWPGVGPSGFAHLIAANGLSIRLELPPAWIHLAFLRS